MAATDVEQQTGCPGSLAGNLCWLLSQVTHALLTQQSAALEAVGLSPRAHCVLAAALEGEHTQSELAQAVGLDKTTMVVTVDELEADGLAERRPSKTDRRARIIAVTPAGREKVAEAERVVHGLQEQVLATLPSRDRDALGRALGALIAGPLATTVACSKPPRRRASRGS